jgi:hypothetical protein
MEAALSEGIIWGICPHRGSRAAIGWEAPAWAYGEPIAVRPVGLDCYAGGHISEPEELPRCSTNEPSESRCNQGSCKVVRQAVDLRECWRGWAATPQQKLAVASTDRPPGRSDLGRSRVLTMQVEGAAVAQEA